MPRRRPRPRPRRTRIRRSRPTSISGERSMPSSDVRGAARVLAILAVLVAGPSLPSLAHAAPPSETEKKEQAKKLATEADQSYKLGRFEVALAGFEKAYEIFPAPGLLFNIAQCHRALRHWERALF